MSATPYKILQWVAVMGPNNAVQAACFIKPDINFLEFSRRNNYELICHISGTNTRFDGRMVRGYVNNSSHMPNCRPNFGEATGFYIVTLDMILDEYPMYDSLGFLSFYGNYAVIQTPKGTDKNYCTTPNNCDATKMEVCVDPKKNIAINTCAPNTCECRSQLRYPCFNNKDCPSIDVCNKDNVCVSPSN